MVADSQEAGDLERSKGRAEWVQGMEESWLGWRKAGSATGSDFPAGRASKLPGREFFVC